MSSLDTRRRPSARHPFLLSLQPNGSDRLRIQEVGRSSIRAARARLALARHGCCTDPGSEGRISAANLRDARSSCPAAATTDHLRIQAAGRQTARRVRAPRSLATAAPIPGSEGPTGAANLRATSDLSDRRVHYCSTADGSPLGSSGRSPNGAARWRACGLWLSRSAVRRRNRLG